MSQFFGILSLMVPQPRW